MQIKKYFTISEILAISFVFLTFVLFITYFTYSNAKYAIFISKWQRIFEEAKYSYLVFLTKKQDMSNLTNFFPVQREEKSNLPKVINNHKYYFKNGKSLNSDSKYYIEKFYILEDNSLMGIKILDTEEKSGIIIFDMNGKKGPNRLGKDIFGVDISKNSIEPFGYKNTEEEIIRNCSIEKHGAFCSEFFLIGGQTY